MNKRDLRALIQENKDQIIRHQRFYEFKKAYGSPRNKSIVLNDIQKMIDGLKEQIAKLEEELKNQV